MPYPVRVTMLALGLALPQAAAAQGWWQLSDAEFAEAFADAAFSDDIALQSEVSWMLWARINQPVAVEGQTFATWQTWPSNPDTFRAEALPPIAARVAPDLQVSKAEQADGQFETLPGKAGEERTRNMLSYDYIRGNGLITESGVAAYLTRGGAVDLPLGAVEIKADWVDGRLEGAYQYVTDAAESGAFSLAGLHVMMKMAPRPADPFTSEEPSWFWTTFEFQGNEGLAHAQGFLTYGDVLGPDAGHTIVQAAGLDAPFTNYVSNGTQIRFSDAANPNIAMGNTKMEEFAGFPLPPKDMDNLPPSQWTNWNTSCHTCHATASYSLEFGGYFPFEAQIGTGALMPGLMSSYASMDFVWSIPFYAKDPAPKAE